MRKIFTSLCICLCLTGCMHFSWGYAPSEKMKTYDITTEQKVPLTFYVVLEQIGSCGSSASNKTELAEKIKKALEETGLFSNVRYDSSDTVRHDSYNVVFRFRRSCSESTNFSAFSSFWPFTLCLVPMGENYYLDASVAVNLRGSELAVYGKEEELSCLYWLPCIVVYPVANGYFVWGNAEDRIISGLVNDFTKYHMEHFADK